MGYMYFLQARFYSLSSSFLSAYLLLMLYEVTGTQGITDLSLANFYHNLRLNSGLKKKHFFHPHQ